MNEWTQDLSDDFFTDGAAMCVRLGASWRDVLAVMYAESGCNADAINHAGSGAVGLIQFLPVTLRRLGWTEGPAAFGALSAEAQLPWVERYFAPYRGKLDTLAGVYLSVWMPADIEHRDDPSFVLVERRGRRAWAYEMNAGLDADGDGRITVGELEEAVRRQCRGKRWEEIGTRVGLACE